METAKIPETRDQALQRLARRARESGVRIYRYPSTNEAFASSLSRPGELHRLTTESCDCEGFVRHQRCTHYALFLAELGWLSLPEPDPTGSALEIPDDALEEMDVLAELRRLENLNRACELKSTADFKRLHAARAAVASLAAPVAAVA